MCDDYYDADGFLIPGGFKRPDDQVTIALLANARTNCCAVCFLLGEECDPKTAPHSFEDYE